MRADATFGDVAKRWQKRALHDHAPTTRADFASMLRPESPVMRHLGALEVKRIAERHLDQLWTVEVVEAGRSRRTGSKWLSCVHHVLEAARCDSPVPAFRKRLASKPRTRSRRLAEKGEDARRPIEDPAALDALLSGAHQESRQALTLCVLLLDAGLRLGEALALRWDALRFGRDEHDRTRSLRVEASLSRGQHLGPTKTGASRDVAMSRRLRALLLEHPGAHEGLVLEGLPHASNFRRWGWVRIQECAGVEGLRLKDFRDTFASHLLSCGVPIGYVSRQLGHGDLTITVRHYARWLDRSEYQEPLALKPGEVPADLLSRLPPLRSGA